MQPRVVFHLYHSPKEVFEGPYATHTSVIQKLQSLMFGFVIKKKKRSSAITAKLAVCAGYNTLHSRKAYRLFSSCFSFQMLSQTCFSVSEGELPACGSQWKLFHWLQGNKSSLLVSKLWNNFSVASGGFCWQNGEQALSECECAVIYRVQRNNFEIVVIKAEFGLLTASEENPKITSEILGGFSYLGAMLL